MFVGVAEHVEHEERQQRSQCGHGDGRENAKVRPQEDIGIEQACYRAEARGQSVNAVDKVDGVDDEDYKKPCQEYRRGKRQLVYAQKPVKIADPDAADDHEGGRYSLHDELGAVFHAHKIVGHACEVEDYGSAAGEAQRLEIVVDPQLDGNILRQSTQAEKEQQGEQNGREKRYAAQTRHLGLVYLARIGRVEQILAECYQKYLRYDYPRHRGHAQENGEIDQKPSYHRVCFGLYQYWLFERSDWR